MKIQIDGANTINQGAELMIYSVIKEVQSKFPKAEIIYNDNCFTKENRSAKTFNASIKFSKKWFHHPIIVKCIQLFRLDIIWYKLTGHLITWQPIKGIDILLDISGLYFTDKWPFTSGIVNAYEYYLKTMKKYGTKIYFLPQAFGPIEKKETKRMISLICKYGDYIFARDTTSYHFIKPYINNNNLYLFPDFTNNIIGDLTAKNQFTKGHVCFIPNKRMIDSREGENNNYLSCLFDMISYCIKNKYKVFVLCHDNGDKDICKEIGGRMNIPVIKGINAVETKGIISNSYAVISSRYHGAVSALSSCTPCLVTSWSHKYEALLDDFGQKDKLLDLNDKNSIIRALENILNKDNNTIIRKQLSVSVKNIQYKTLQMWDIIWKNAM